MRISIRGVTFDDVSADEALEQALTLIRTAQSTCTVHTPNAEIVQLCVEKPECLSLINSAELIVPDGSGVILASRILGRPLKKGKVAGVVLGERLAEEAAKPENAFPLFLLGGKPGIAETAAEKLQEKYPGLIIAGTHDGYFQDDGAVTEQIRQSGAKLLYVCLGVPKQEEWMAAHKKSLPCVRLMAGLGGSLDVYAGVSRRAPKLFIACGCEWLYRLLREPKRIGRMMKLPKFVCGTVAARFRERRTKH